MGRVKDLKRLMRLIVHVVTRTVRIEHAEIYLLDKEAGQYTLRAAKSNKMHNRLEEVLSKDLALIEHLKHTHQTVVFEEMEQKAQDYKDSQLKDVAHTMRILNGDLVVPSFVERDLIAVIVLGKKRSGKVYVQDDLAVFSILANQAALAIENAQFYDEMKKTHEKLFKADKMAAIGTMADGLSHQINNRFNAMEFIAGDALDTIKLKKKESLSDDMKFFVGNMEYCLDKIRDNVKRGGEIVEGLLKYTRKGNKGFEEIGLHRLIKAVLEMLQFKIKLSEMRIVKNYDETTPEIFANFTQLQEVFFNIIDNSYDAMMQRKEELKEDGYKPTLKISAEVRGENLEILIEDNGIGVKGEDKDKLFTPFFTTKASSNKGTGLGLYVIRKIIEENHHGTVEFSSEYKAGSQTRIVLQVAEEFIN